MLDIREMLKNGIEKGASDLHLSVDALPVLRIHGRLFPLKEYGALSPTNIKEMIYSILNGDQKAIFEKDHDLDFSILLPNLGRFRANIFFSQGNTGASLRFIPLKIKSIQELGLPQIVSSFCQRRSGLVIVTGPTGSGKTSTLAAMIDFINGGYSKRIVTIEDPVEYIHFHRKSMVIQREVYLDTHSFAKALRQSLRQDPDVICVGEMRDLETISTTLTAAETGHLVFSTLHTPDTIETINRIIDIFPPHQQEQVRVQLASCLGAVIAQKLLTRKDGKGLALASEILMVNTAIRNMIKQRVVDQIASVLQTKTSEGMCLMDNSILELFQNGLIDKATALSELKSIKNREYIESQP